MNTNTNLATANVDQLIKNLSECPSQKTSLELKRHLDRVGFNDYLSNRITDRVGFWIEKNSPGGLDNFARFLNLYFRHIVNTYDTETFFLHLDRFQFVVLDWGIISNGEAEYRRTLYSPWERDGGELHCREN